METELLKFGTKLQIGNRTFEIWNKTSNWEQNFKLGTKLQIGNKTSNYTKLQIWNKSAEILKITFEIWNKKTSGIY